MSQIDPRILRAIGVELSGYDVPIPLYCRRRAIPYTEVGVPLYRAQPLPLSLQYLVSVVLQITDPVKFRRCIHIFENKIKYYYQSQSFGWSSDILSVKYIFLFLV